MQYDMIMHTTLARKFKHIEYRIDFHVLILPSLKNKTGVKHNGGIYVSYSIPTQCHSLMYVRGDVTILGTISIT